ncbi:unnamed protein product [Arctia plantaginis]|uniref:Uncharacterized protein n=1 Tax=Arctia plantaginis TaxID=874455 RepID=A0A8S1A6F2_ARCPL|nr:unnamed protein product [Arctia plantaginis]
MSEAETRRDFCSARVYPSKLGVLARVRYGDWRAGCTTRIAGGTCGAALCMPAHIFSAALARHSSHPCFLRAIQIHGVY